MTAQTPFNEPIYVGISTCLLGERVRFDAGHKRDRFITDTLAGYFTFVPVCPELEVGMGVPREAVRLIGTAEKPGMIGVKSGIDWTDRMHVYSVGKVKELESFRLSGYILKSDSPSCGMERVRVYAGNGMPMKNGRGLFAEVLIKHFPLVPVEEEGRLNDAVIRENFITRVFGSYRLHHLFSKRFSRRTLIEFHTVHKYLLLAHSPKHYENLGKLVANQKRYAPSELKEIYGTLFLEALKVKSTVKKNVNVLQHILGYLKDHLTPEDKQDIISSISDYSRALVPLVVPLTLISHYIKKFDITYIRDQVYLNPHPKELLLRNRV